MIYAKRYHDISTGHRVHGHESKCRGLHGHNYRIHFTVQAIELDALGRVVDFGVIKSTLCAWVEEHWDHKFLLWRRDPMLMYLGLDHASPLHADQQLEVQSALRSSLVEVPFNPTAENMALYLLEVVGPKLLPEGLILRSVLIEETRKCSAEVSV